MTNDLLKGFVPVGGSAPSGESAPGGFELPNNYKKKAFHYPKELEAVESFLRNARDALTFGTGDAMTGTFRGVRDKFDAWINKEFPDIAKHLRTNKNAQDLPLGELINQHTEVERSRTGKLADKHPVASTAGTVTGVVVGPGKLLKPTVAAARFIPRVLEMTVRGGLFGAANRVGHQIEKFLRGEGDLGKVVDDAKTGAIVGALVPAATTVANVAGKVVGALGSVGRNIARKFGISGNQVLNRLVQRAAKNPQAHPILLQFKQVYERNPEVINKLIGAGGLGTLAAAFGLTPAETKTAGVASTAAMAAGLAATAIGRRFGITQTGFEANTAATILNLFPDYAPEDKEFMSELMKKGFKVQAQPESVQPAGEQPDLLKGFVPVQP